MIKFSFTNRATPGPPDPDACANIQQSAAPGNFLKPPRATWSKIKRTVGRTCLDALAKPARLLGCGPSRQSLFEMRVEYTLDQAGLGHLHDNTVRQSRSGVEKWRLLDVASGRTGKSKKLVSSRPFQSGGDGDISIIGLGDQRFWAAKSFRGTGASATDDALKEAHLTARFGDPEARVAIDDAGQPHLLMQLAAGSLHDLGRALPEGDTQHKRRLLARKTLREVASQLANMHDQGWIHRDVKPGNILCYEDGTVRLADFGRSRATNETKRSGSSGTIMFAPLEVLFNEQPAAAHSDVWSLGMTVLNTLVSLDASPVRINDACFNAAIMASVIDALLELRAVILQDGSIDMNALTASENCWAPYLRKACAVDAELTAHVLRTMVAPPEERMDAGALSATGNERYVDDADAQTLAMQKLCVQNLPARQHQKATCIALDAAVETFARKRV